MVCGPETFRESVLLVATLVKVTLNAPVMSYCVEPSGKSVTFAYSLFVGTSTCTAKAQTPAGMSNGPAGRNIRCGSLLADAAVPPNSTVATATHARSNFLMRHLLRAT